MIIDHNESGAIDRGDFKLRKPGQRSGPTSRACERSAGCATRLLDVLLVTGDCRLMTRMRLVWGVSPCVSHRRARPAYKDSLIMIMNDAQKPKEGTMPQLINKLLVGR